MPHATAPGWQGERSVLAVLRLRAPLHDLGHIPMREPQGTRQGRARRVIRGEHPADPEVQGRHLMVVPVITAQRLPTGLGRAVVAIWPDGTGLIEERIA